MQNMQMTLCPQNCSELSSLSDQPSHSDSLTFAFLFEVLALFSSGVITIIWGALFVSGSLILAGFLVTLLGMALYGWSLSAEL